MKKRTFFSIGMMTFSNAAVRVLGMLYKVWLAGMISPPALGIYQLSMSLYTVFITPVASGLPNATARLCAKYSDEKKEKDVLASAVKLALVPLMLSGIIMILLKDVLAGMFLHEQSAYGAVLALVPAVTVGALAALPAGYFHACGKSGYPAFFEIIEQLAKIAFAFAVIKLFSRGTLGDAALPALAVSFGGVLSFFMLFLCVGKLDMKKGGFTRELLQNAVPPTLARLATSLLHLATTTVLPLKLMSFGLSREAALSEYGILTSMAYPVVFIPVTVTSALCVVYMPQVAKNLQNPQIIKKKFFSSFLFALAVSAGFAILLLLFAPFAATKIFSQPLAGRYMVMLIPSVLFTGINQVCASTLSGMGRQKTLMAISIIDGCIGLLLTVLLAGTFGIYGFIIGNGIQDALAFLMYIFSLIRWRKKYERIACGQPKLG